MIFFDFSVTLFNCYKRHFSEQIFFLKNESKILFSLEKTLKRLFSVAEIDGFLHKTLKNIF